ncbi:hypothetical protein ACIBG8_40370 [Nonomuraea sp. NPDC050556]|uniref:hypothetical protein n=1 Tax=Nonomuraea sp. NPDC050556 TaxID=3364369 RepID=UPI0037B4F910
MTQHAEYVHDLCEKGHFSWAHSYVDRLIADRPDDPEPAALKAEIQAAQAEQGTRAPRSRSWPFGALTNVGVALIALATVRLADWALFGRPSFPSVQVGVGALAAVCLLWSLIRKRRRSQTM